MKKYAQIVSKCWESLVGKEEPNGSYFFSKSDLEKAAKDLGFAIKNIADIRYTFDSREDLPIKGYGILQQGKGKYVFTPVDENLINVDFVDSAILLPDQLQGFAKKYITDDEQGRFARLIKSGVFSKIYNWSGIERIQDHWRTTSDFGQIEIDSLCSVIEEDREKLLLINVKKNSDRISKTYLYNQARLASQKFTDPWEILNIYCLDDIYILWQVSNIQDIGSIQPKNVIVVKLY